MKKENPDTRKLYDLKDVLYDQEWLKQSENHDLYYMYRGLKKEKGARYDITVIPPRKLGQEFVKTKGHYHPDQFGELYLILSGQAICLIQKTDKENIVQDVYAVKAKEKEYVMIPPGYGHLTINPGDETLEMANWVNDEFHSDYSLIEKNKGGAYYYLTNHQWVKNENYQKVPPLRFEDALESMPNDLSFLKK
jgi:glucose-6-phosphate isomerase, archaeal